MSAACFAIKDRPASELRRRGAPPQAAHTRVPALLYLAGLTCNEETFAVKAGAQRMAASLGVALIAPDTSPRGAGPESLPGAKDSWDFGIGAGFYLAGVAFLEKLKIDDVVGAVPVHGFCGIWGVVATGLFASEKQYANAYYSSRAAKCAGVFYGGDGNMLAANLVFVLAVATGALRLILPLLGVHIAGYTL